MTQGEKEVGRDGRSVLVRMDLAVAGSPVHVEAVVPERPVRPIRLLPVIRSIAGKVMDRGVREVEEQGLRVSCRTGCAACCRHLVPVSETEARRLREIVEELPEPRRSVVRARFAEVIRRVEEAGLLEMLRDPERVVDDELDRVGLRYFHMRLDCPFLEDERCSIYEERPIACRDFMVTSPAENCWNPTPETVEGVPYAGEALNALERIDGGPETRRAWWIALPLALEWTDAHPDTTPAEPGTEILDRFLRLLGGEEPPPRRPSGK